MIDLHSHVLPGIDDGPGTIEQSVVLARAAAAAGTRTLLATPHVSRRYPNDAERIAHVTSELNDRLVELDVPITIVPGAEIALTHLADLSPDQLTRLGLGGSRCLLLEPPFLPTAAGIDLAALDLQRRGHRILLAHPERCPAFQRDPALLARLVEQGIMTSVTASSLSGLFGEPARRFALDLFNEGLVHNVASDAHGVRRRTPEISSHLADAGFGPLLEWLTLEVPAALLADVEVPPRPSHGPPVDRAVRRLLRRLAG
jgi:protein-tyrosine phosphatase